MTATRKRYRLMSLIDGQASNTAVRMGRPPLGNVATQVRLPKAVMERIDALLGANQRAKFIREAVENELKRREEGAAISHGLPPAKG